MPVCTNIFIKEALTTEMGYSIANFLTKSYPYTLLDLAGSVGNNMISRYIVRIKVYDIAIILHLVILYHAIYHDINMVITL